MLCISSTHDKRHPENIGTGYACTSRYSTALLLPHELLSVDAGTLRFKVQVYGARVDARLKGVVGQRPTRAKSDQQGQALMFHLTGCVFTGQLLGQDQQA